jgi:hypothetical protein
MPVYPMALRSCPSNTCNKRWRCPISGCLVVVLSVVVLDRGVSGSDGQKSLLATNFDASALKHRLAPLPVEQGVQVGIITLRVEQALSYILGSV